MKIEKNINFLFILFSIINLPCFKCKNLSNTSQEKIYKNSCLVSCQDCGKYTKNCIFDPIKCTIKCECDDGYTGETCNMIILNNIPFDIDTTQTLIGYKLRKENAWNYILKNLNNSKFNEQNALLIEDLIRKINFVFTYISYEKQLEPSDIYKFNIFLESFTRLNLNKILLNEILFEKLFDLLDKIITLNKIKSFSQKSILFKANLKYNKSSLRLINSFEKLAKFFSFSNNQKVIQYKNFEIIILEVNLNNNSDIKFELSVNDNYNYSLKIVDSIILNEKILRKRYKNKTIKVALKIYYNYKIHKELNESNINIKRSEYYKVTEENSNFFYEITQPESFNYIDKNENTKVFVSSNVLSAEILDCEDFLADSNKIKEYDKLVRIQFVFDLSQYNQAIIENKLKCVFWNFTKLEWSTNGCFTSNKESSLIKDTSFYQKVCYCNHLTNFAVIFDPNDEISDSNNIFKKFLTFLTFIGISISSICYLILIINRLFCITIDKHINLTAKLTNLNTDPNTQTNIVKSIIFKIHNPIKKSYRDGTLRKLYLSNTICLFASNLAFVLVVLIKPKINFELCKLVSAVLHFFLISSFCFSLGIAWQHFKKLVKIFKEYDKNSKFLKKEHFSRFLNKWFIFSTLIPFLFSLFGYLSDKNDLKIILSDSCWLKTPYLYYLFITPITIMLLLSLFFYVIVCIKVLSIYNNLKQNKNKKNNNRSNFNNLNFSYNNKRVVVILTFSFISFGLTWLIGVLYVISNHIDESLKMLMELLFCLFNSFHGLTLLIGNLLAHKYSKSNDFSKNTKIRSNTNQKSKESQKIKNSKLNNSTSNFDSISSTNKRKRSISSMGYSLFCCCSKTISGNKKTKATKRNFKTNKDVQTILEFSKISYKDSDTNRQNLQTILANLPNEGHIYSENLCFYLNSNSDNNKKTEKDNPSINENSVLGLKSEVFTSSV